MASKFSRRAPASGVRLARGLPAKGKMPTQVSKMPMPQRARRIAKMITMPSAKVSAFPAEVSGAGSG